MNPHLSKAIDTRTDKSEQGRKRQMIMKSKSQEKSSTAGNQLPGLNKKERRYE